MELMLASAVFVSGGRCSCRPMKTAWGESAKRVMMSTRSCVGIQSSMMMGQVRGMMSWRWVPGMGVR
eukprot:3398577-Rhodomonas_salina.1